RRRVESQADPHQARGLHPRGTAGEARRRKAGESGGGGLSRRRKAEPAANHDRWLVSYADFITLMFAFFVVMFASSQTDRSRAQKVSESISDAFNNDKLGALAGI